MNTFCVPGAGLHDFIAQGAPPTRPWLLPTDEARPARPSARSTMDSALRPLCACSEAMPGRRTADSGWWCEGDGSGKPSLAGRGPGGGEGVQEREWKDAARFV